MLDQLSRVRALRCNDATSRLFPPCDVDVTRSPPRDERALINLGAHAPSPAKRHAMNLAFNTTTAHVGPTMLDDYFPTVIDVDGRALALRIKRLDLDEYSRFTRDFARIGRMAKRDALFVEKHRQPLRDKLTNDPLTDAAGKVRFEDDETVLARLELEESVEQRIEREKRDAEDNAFSTKFLVDSITQFVVVESGQLTSASAAITTGEQLLRYYAGRQDDVLQRVLALIYTENVLSDEQKKTLASRHASQRSSTDATPTAHGDAHETTAASASQRDSASHEDATASSAMSSGATAPSS